MSVRFIHTSDWQLGMTRHFFDDGAQERYGQSRFDAIRTMGRIAKEERCQFMLVSGDAFESNQVDRKTVLKALEALKQVPVPVYILPGNHDPLNAASVYRSSTFVDRKPENVNVVEATDPVEIGESVELMGAPWMSKRVPVNPVEKALAALQPVTGMTRICMAHGCVDTFAPDKGAPGVIAAQVLQDAIDDGRATFIALGDRHSLTRIGSGDSIWYSGTPEATDFSEPESGCAQVVEITDGRAVTKKFQVGKWRFVERDRIDMNTLEDIEALQKSLDVIENKERTVVRLKLVGSLSLSLKGVLQDCLVAAKDLFGAFDLREDELYVKPDDTDFADTGFSGFAEAAVNRLRADIEVGGEAGALASDALMLLLRLAKGAA